jgi:hemoglobin
MEASSVNASLYERIGGHDGILKLIRPFYADVRQHAVLGPIFNAHIQNWPAHFEKIAEFWARQMGGPSRYPGGFGAAHLQLGIGAEHLAHWLTLWDFNCQRNLPAAEATEASELAHRIGGQLERLLSGRGGLGIRQ